MIKSIYWDIDETLVHSSRKDPNQDHLQIDFPNDRYYTIVRPCAQRIIDFSRDLVGRENVFILTAATTDYVRAINEKAGWGFPDEQIFAREDQEKYSHRGAYGGTQYVDSPQAHPDNVLIDNLPPRYNESKIAFLGIWRTCHANYLQVREYWGVNFPDNPFEVDVKEFLIERFESQSDAIKTT